MPLRRTLLLALISLSTLPAQTAGVEDDSLEWLDNYQEAIAQAKATGKPIFLEYRCEP